VLLWTRNPLSRLGVRSWIAGDRDGRLVLEHRDVIELSVKASMLYLDGSLYQYV
jgi:hypothetical protein